MATTITCADLKNNYDDISRICHETKEPVYITKDGEKDLVLLSKEAYYDEFKDKKMQEIEYEMFYKEYPDVESFKKDVYEKIEIGLKQVEEGKYTPAEDFFKEMEEKYNLWSRQWEKWSLHFTYIFRKKRLFKSIIKFKILIQIKIQKN